MFRMVCDWLRFIDKVIVSVVLAFILGWSLPLFGKIFLLLLFNIFAIPLLFVFTGFPLWLYYVIILEWIADWVFFHQVEKKEA